MSFANSAGRPNRTSPALECDSESPKVHPLPSNTKAEEQKEARAQWNPRRDHGAAKSQNQKTEWRWVRYPASLALIGMATVFSLLLRPILEPANLLMLFLLSVVISALRWGHMAAIVAAVSGTMLFDYFYIPPFFIL